MEKSISTETQVFNYDYSYIIYIIIVTCHWVDLGIFLFQLGLLFVDVGLLLGQCADQLLMIGHHNAEHVLLPGVHDQQDMEKVIYLVSIHVSHFHNFVLFTSQSRSGSRIFGIVRFSNQNQIMPFNMDTLKKFLDIQAK